MHEQVHDQNLASPFKPGLLMKPKKIKKIFFISKKFLASPKLKKKLLL